MRTGMLVLVSTFLLPGCCDELGAEGALGVTASIEAATVDCAGLATLSIEATGIELEEPHDGAAHGDHAHYHVYFHDDTGDPIAAGWTPSIQVQLPASATPGSHELHVVLMENDHTRVEGAAHGVVTVDVTDSACVLPSLADPTATPGSAAQLAVEVGNFTLEAPGQPAADGYGHYHVYFHDTTGEPIATGYTPTIAAPIPVSAATGTHDLHVVLMNSDHTDAGAPHGVVALTVE